ncbi:MAG: hypothetical protein ACSLFQ_23780 [Thermoanaerobaculia bacterium]
MKIATALFGIAVSLFALDLSASSLLLNSGFDRDLAEWKPGIEPSVKTEWVNQDASASAASGSARLTFNGAGTQGTAEGLVQVVPVVGSSSYTLSASVKSGSGGSTATIVVNWLTSQKVPVGNATLMISPAGTSFTPGMTSTSSPSDAALAVVRLLVPRQSGVVMLFDDVSLVGQAGSAAPAVLFTATPSSVRPGQPSRLSWGAMNATGVTIDNGVGAKGPRGTADVAPSVTTTYTLTATGPGGNATTTAIVEVLSASSVSISRFPPPILQLPGATGGTTQYTLTNLGGASASVVLSQDGEFFSQTPTSFTLAAGGSQDIRVTATTLTQGEYKGGSIIKVDGVEIPRGAPIVLLASPPPAGPVDAVPAQNRVDLNAAPGTNPNGSVTFSNPGTGTLTGVVTTDVAWITLSQNTITIASGSSATISFTIDRAQRPDGDDPQGSASGTVTVSYYDSTSGSKLEPMDGTSTSLATVVVIDTVSGDTTSSSVPTLAADEIGLLIAGVGHVVGSGGKEFVSDVSIANSLTSSISDLDLYYTSTSASSSSSESLSGSGSVALADVVTTYFGQTSQVGTMHFRSDDVTSLSVNANVFNKSNAAGTYGTALPTFRTDRSTSSGQSIVLGGLVKSDTSHTNLYLQEMAGGTATASIAYLDALGNTLSTTDGVSLTGWGLTSISDAAPSGAVAAIITNTSGAFSAFATPVDDASGDTWAVADWRRQYDSTGSEPMVIPVVGAAAGANNTSFRSDVTITNLDASAASLSLYYSATGETKSLDFAASETKQFSNIVAGYLEVSGTSVGALFVTPSSEDAFAVTSRTYTKGDESAATYGTGVPTLPASEGLSLGESQTFGGLEDSTTATVNAAQGGTFRTNFGMVEVGDSSVTVEVSVSFSDGAQLAAGGSNGSQTYTLSAKQYLQMNGLLTQILGDSRSDYGDLHNIQVKFTVISGDGRVIPFITTTDNGTGDTALRTE